MVALRAPDELFNQTANFAAVPDIGWPDCFNSGLLVLSPNMGDYYALLALASRGISFDGADQGLLNMHFRDWHRLSFTYNCTPSGNYQYVPAYRHFQSSVSMIHFIGTDKPWRVGKDWQGATGVYEELLGRWWAVYDKYYHRPVRSLSHTGILCNNHHVDRRFCIWPARAGFENCTAICERGAVHNGLWLFFHPRAISRARAAGSYNRDSTQRGDGACRGN